MASTLITRRIFSQVKNIRVRQHVTGGQCVVMRVSIAGCHSAGTTTTTTTSPPPTDATKSEQKVEGWDLAQVENLLQEASLSDMPVAMKNPYEQDPVQCLLCKYQVPVDYKNVRLLSQFISPFTGRVYGRNITRLCKKQQERLENAIKKSQNAGFMAVMLKSVEFLKDPKLFDPNNPFKPHNY
ncbi:hypothetical protein Pmani_004343 [Petrolisthes manimaculis]|uniref:Mitochondrial ribosomal protein S18C n=1 Tax=Petrolisthes manimaculis TaxID=1843537 RepID=A0AAE1QH04_9EUCA|nr:hypothetical protein Pmani_004343 [Petrolisthes manimaculis]